MRFVSLYSSAGMIRITLIAAACLLLAIAFVRTAPAGGQAAVSFSRAGQEDLSFWVNHNGLEQFDIEGEVGFGDMARILMRRRANRDAMRALRDRFVFTVRDVAALRTPDVFRAEFDGHELRWVNRPERIVIAAGRVTNAPVIIENTSGSAVRIEGRSGVSTFAADLGPNRAGGYFLKLGGAVVLRAGEREISATPETDARPLVRLRVRLIDERGSPIAARVYLTAADGLAYAPKGAISRIAAMSAEYYFHAQGSFDFDLPAGKTLIEATRGQEYELALREIELKPGAPAEIELRLARWVDLASRGWYSADAHIHANYTAEHHQVITPEDVRIQTLAEDLNNANLMVANSSGAFLHDERYFEGKPHALTRPAYVMYWNEEMRNNGPYGHMCFFNLKTLVAPLYTGFKDTTYWEDYPANYTLAEGARKQGGAVTYAHPGYQPTLDGASARELPVDLALGQIDAMDVLSNNFEPATMELWYRLLNCGFRLGISAGTDSFTNVADHYTPGGGRVYARVSRPPSPVADWYADWIRSYRQGRTFASNGPAVSLSVDDKEPGDELRFPEGAARKLRVRASVETQLPVDSLDIIVNGKVAATIAAKGERRVDLERALTLDRSSWIAARALGPWRRLVLNDAQVFAHTSPVYVRFGDRPAIVAEDVRFYIDWIERLIARVDQRGRFATPAHKQDVLDLFRRALDVYRERER